jgi:hypothetical protein
LSSVLALARQMQLSETNCYLFSFEEFFHAKRLLFEHRNPSAVRKLFDAVTVCSDVRVAALMDGVERLRFRGNDLPTSVAVKCSGHRA